MKFYLVGIKGSGMCSLANILDSLGYEVTGCDYSKKFFTDKKLTNFKIDDINNLVVDNKYIYIIGNAYKNIDTSLMSNVYNYPEFIELFFRMPKISISGTHGKTTTTYFLSQIIEEKINLLCGEGSGFGDVDASYLILEACEYKNTFLNYTNKILLINNIEYDHPDFFDNINDVIMSFQKAANNSQIVLLNGDCTNCLKIKHLNIIRFGMKQYNDIKFIYKQIEKQIILTIYFYGNKEEIVLPLLSKQNIYNFVASFIIAKLIDSNEGYLYEKAKELKLPERRAQTFHVGNSILIDDYAHHPTEIKTTLLYLKEIYSNFNIVVFFQPHTYSRTNVFRNEFIDALSICDEVYILDVFSSVREKGSGNVLLDNTKFKKFEMNLLDDITNNNKVYVFMGAGDINNILHDIIKKSKILKKS